MDEKNFSIYDSGYFGISFLDVDEYAGNLVYKTVDSMVKRKNGIVFTDAVASYDSAHRALSVEGIAVDLTNETVALGGLTGCVNAVRGLNSANYPLAS